MCEPIALRNCYETPPSLSSLLSLPSDSSSEQIGEEATPRTDVSEACTAPKTRSNITEFRWRKRLINHFGDILKPHSTYNQDKPLFCVSCDISFQQRLDYKIHMKFEHRYDLKKRLKDLKLDSILPIRSSLSSTKPNSTGSLSQFRLDKKLRLKWEQHRPASKTDLTADYGADYKLTSSPFQLTDAPPCISWAPPSQGGATEQAWQIEGFANIEGSPDSTESPRRPLDSPGYDFETLSATPESAEQLHVEQDPLVRRLEQLQAELVDLDRGDDSYCTSETESDSDSVACDPTDAWRDTDHQGAQHETDCDTRGVGQVTGNTSSCSGNPSDSKSSNSNDAQASNRKVSLPVSQEANGQAENVKVATSRGQSEQRDPTVIPCPMYSNLFPCCGKNKAMADLARVLRTKSHNKQYCHPCKRLFPTGALYEAHRENCSDHCVVPSCPNSTQGLRHEHNKLTCEKTQSVRKQAEYTHLCLLLSVPPRELQDGTERSHHGQRRKCISAQNRKLAADAVQDNIDLKSQLASCQQQVTDLEHEVFQGRKEYEQFSKALMGAQKENKELLLIIKHALHEMSKAGVAIPDILRERVELHAPVALDSLPVGAKHDNVTGLNQTRHLYTPISSSSSQSSEYQTKPTLAADATSPSHYRACSKLQQGETLTLANANKHLSIPLDPNLSSNLTLGTEARQRNNNLKNRADHGNPHPDLYATLQPLSKRRRTTPDIQDTPMTNALEQSPGTSSVIDNGPGQDFPGATTGTTFRRIPPSQNVNPPDYFPEAPWQSGQQQHFLQMPQKLSAPVKEKSNLPEDLTANIADTALNSYPTDGIGKQQLTVPSPDHDSTISRSDNDSAIQLDPVDIPSLQMPAEATDMQDFEHWSLLPSIPNEGVEKEPFFFLDDAAFAKYDWFNPPTSPSLSLDGKQNV